MNGATSYTPPTEAILLALRVAGIAELCQLRDFAHVDADSVRNLLTEFGHVARTVIEPTDRIGDREGSVMDHETGHVRTPAAFKSAYAQYVDGGWGAMIAPTDDGGEAFPWLVGLGTQELFASANLALSLTQVLTQSAVELLRRWGTAEQRTRYMRPLVTGEWTGTMNLTEPEAGSDLGGVRTRAELQPNGRWLITGTKIFITWGDHDLTDNIVHMVLARTPDAPSGTKGLSLFVVPKRLVNEDGSLGEQNEVRCIALERKMGIHGSPTCVLDFQGSVGELVGEEHRGMPAMFTMMNAARLAIGLQGVAVSERAYQQSLGFARTRVQGRPPGATIGACGPIIGHPDVRRMLLTIAASIDASRLLVYVAGAAADTASHHPDENERRAAQLRCNLLTPIAKAWPTDEGVRNTSLALQIHGGMGYVEETGIAQRFRDARIAPIYEGTNGIQAIDLVTRKIGADNGLAMGTVLNEIENTIAALHALDPSTSALDGLALGLYALREATEWVVRASALDDPSDVLAAASPYLGLAGCVIGGWLLCRQALIALSTDDPRSSIALQHAEFFALDRLSAASGLLRIITAGAACLRVLEDY